jgi:methyl-accepting chemotaxis protein
MKEAVMFRKVMYWMNGSIRRKATASIIMVMTVLLAFFFTYDIQTQRNTMEAALLAKGKSMAENGALMVQHILEDAISSGRLTEEQVFDTNYIQIEGINPPKYHTAYDTFTDENFLSIEDGYLNDPDVVFAVAMDRNGYIPTHNTVYSQPLTGDSEIDGLGNRTKRIFNDVTGLAAARNTEPYLRQIYKRDTGETMWDISAPIIVNGQHWGGFRIGFSLVRVEDQLSRITWRILFAGVILLLGIMMAAYMVTRPMKMVTRLGQIADKIVIGDVTQKIDIVRHDEVGILADAFRKIIEYNRNTAMEMDRLSNGDLTVDTQPKSDVDVIGKAFQKMIFSLREIMANIISNAQQLEKSAATLAETSRLTGLATNQIALTIQQVAEGVTQEAATISKAASNVDQLNDAINGVALGAQDQASAAGRAASLTSDISSAIIKVAENAQNVSQGSVNAADAAREGTISVQQTVLGMQSIKNKVGISAEKVREMGTRSQEIGVIVETIGEIASQTNLLALNAAIEAARAGEHGKGFSVVADEVRKLAEHSAASTREITILVNSIQNTVRDATQAMEAGSMEVESGVEQSKNAGKVLAHILESVELVHQQAENAAQMAKQINASTDTLVSAVESVSAVIEENSAASEEMAASSSDVNESISIIASISEENSAAVEEVSASTTEMNEKVEEVNQAAQHLAELAMNMKKIVDKFKLA